MSRSLVFAMIVLTISFANLKCQQINIGLYTNSKITSCVFSVVEGAYFIIGNNKIIEQAIPGKIFYLTIEDSVIIIKDQDKIFGKFSIIHCRGQEINNIFQFKPVNPSLTSRDYDGDFWIYGKNGTLRFINKLDIEKYVAGVLEAESGSNAYLEYYKAQAILIRTYAKKHLSRHWPESYSLCDQVHCQAYKGRSMLNKQIYEATHLTSGMVMTDKSGDLVIPPYHSNCGGKTSSAKMAWQSNLPHLSEITDPFCTKGRNATWTKKISIISWQRYLNKNGIFTASMSKNQFAFNNPNRQKYYVINNKKLLMRDIREYFRLKSTFFSIETSGNDLLFHGKGYGHGVGLCQEGAMEMARVGYTYVDILHFYFQNVKIVKK